MDLQATLDAMRAFSNWIPYATHYRVLAIATINETERGESYPLMVLENQRDLKCKNCRSVHEAIAFISDPSITEEWHLRCRIFDIPRTL